MRPLRDDDAERLLGIWTDPRVARWIGEHTREDVLVELSFHIAQQERAGWSLWALEERASGRFIGDCGLQPLELTGPEVELGYDLHPDVWGEGLATEAARAVVRYAFGRLALEHLVAVVKPEHAASRRVLEKTGLALVGERVAYGESLLMYEIWRGGFARRGLGKEASHGGSAGRSDAC
jgi:ribosomal-protein-alanine N-acetyltransferase